ncbi:MAG: mechanosensitive ion channel [Desulfobulbaceae bacterium]|nr:mechanosensitive ion channel [Desulfobulbaceae bacterium]
MRLPALLLAIVAAFTLTCFPPPATAGQPDDFIPEPARQGLARLEQSLSRARTGTDALDQGLEACSEYLKQGEQCVDTANAEMQQIDQALATLGPVGKNEAHTVSRERQRLAGQKAALEKRLGECRLLVVKATALTETLTVKRRQHLARRLLHRQPDLISVGRDTAEQFPVWLTDARRAIDRRSDLTELADKNAAIIAAVLLAGVCLGLWLQRRLPLPECKSEAALIRLLVALRATVNRGLPWLTPLVAVTGVTSLLSRDVTPAPCLPDLLAGLTGFGLLHLLVKAILRPAAPALPLTPSWPAPLRVKLHRRLLAMGFVTIAIMLCDTPLLDELPAETMALAHNLLFAVTCLLFLRLSMAMAETPPLASFSASGRPLIILTMAMLAGIEWLGFHNLAFYLGRGLLATLLLAVLAWGMHTVFCQLFYMLAYGHKAWRQKFGAARRTPGDAPPSIIWARLLTTILTWSVFAILLIRAWRISDTFTASLLTFLQEGFKIGDINVVPTRIISGLLLFTAIWTLSSWLRNRLEKEWLITTHLASSARDALITVSGYLGFTLATVFGLAAAGVDFTNLAVIAGALSVGIGFGLQNIVNNFVSGLILLLEQPIKRGDWVRVGDTEGYVHKISVRSTIIQTFDRADVIVPNSDLIATPVTNLMLQDRLGRVKVAVGVAYGSDTGKVKRLLEEVAHNHPLVIKDENAPRPEVFFVAFGESSLDFELRCFIHDVNQIFVVRSDLNFAIDAIFRDNQIQIPFPQRDLHVISLPSAGADGRREG